MNKASIQLPWPAKALSPNARVHWRALAAARKTAKNTAFYIARADLPKISAESLSVRYVFYPPSKRAFDVDNLIASMKASADGIALAIGIDDRAFSISGEKRDPVDKVGSVLVQLEWKTGDGRKEAA